MKTASVLPSSRTVVPSCLLGLAAWLVASLVPHVALACPMCFGGNNQNQQAFLYGSLFLMIVPVTAIGSLLYWAYRRYRAYDEPPAQPKAPHVATSRPLQAVSRR
jgi:hypothetical protein